MSTKNKNPYNEGGKYGKIFAFVKKAQVVTRQQVLDYAVKKLRMAKSAANAAVTVVLSPRASSKRGDCRGNMSAQGHLYYLDKLAKKPGEKQKLRLRWRKPALEPRTREKAEVSAEKTSTSAQLAVTE